MSKDRLQILTPEKKIACDQVRWYYITHFYDHPIHGLAQVRGEIYRFCCFPEDVPYQHIYVLHTLSAAELASALRDKAQFEESVGTFWSFDLDGLPLPKVWRSQESIQRYLAANKLLPAHHPYDRDVVAWFDTDQADSGHSG